MESELIKIREQQKETWNKFSPGWKKWDDFTMNFLKPMAQFHLPFSQFEETIARTISIYLLQQHYFLEKGNVAEVSLENLRRCYTEVNQVNRGIAARFRQLKMKASSKNGVVILDALATLVPMELSEGYKNFESLFERIDSHKPPRT